MSWNPPVSRTEFVIARETYLTKNALYLAVFGTNTEPGGDEADGKYYQRVRVQWRPRTPGSSLLVAREVVFRPGAGHYTYVALCANAKAGAPNVIEVGEIPLHTLSDTDQMRLTFALELLDRTFFTVLAEPATDPTETHDNDSDPTPRKS